MSIIGHSASSCIRPCTTGESLYSSHWEFNELHNSPYFDQDFPNNEASVEVYKREKVKQMRSISQF